MNAPVGEASNQSSNSMEGDMQQDTYVIGGLLEEARRSLRLARECRRGGYTELSDVLEQSTVKIYQFIEQLRVEFPEAQLIVDEPVRNIH